MSPTSSNANGNKNGRIKTATTRKRTRRVGSRELRILVMQGTDEVLVSVPEARPLWTNLGDITAAYHVQLQQEAESTNSGGQQVMKKSGMFFSLA